jgi:hypothetical protein
MSFFLRVALQGVRRMQFPLIGLVLAICAALGSGSAFAQSHDHTEHPVLGNVHFPTTCSPAAQTAFDQGMQFQHSFWHRPARESFRKAVAEDPSCGIAYWGEALSVLNNPFNPPLAANMREGRALLQKAREIGAASQRELDYIAALTLLFAGDDRAGHPARMARYRDAMADLHARYPDDAEASIAYALALVMAASLDDKSYASQLAAGQILEREFARQPHHPGVIHYLIHAYDAPPLAARGLEAAQKYALIAPDTPHALHMPSHIFTRLGRWQDSIATNKRSAEVALAHGERNSALHAMDYLIYAYLQTGQIAAAAGVVRQAAEVDRWTPDQLMAGGYAAAAIPARYALERGDWAKAAALPQRTYGVPQVDSITHFARALGAARVGNPIAAQADIVALQGAAESLRATDAYWSEQVEIQCLVAEGWVARAEGHPEQGLAYLTEAAEREGKTEKHGISPGPLSPAREQLAEMLLKSGRPQEAQFQFEAVLYREPRRLRSVWGAARSADQAGNKPAARVHYHALMEIASQAYRRKPEMLIAKTFLDAGEY